MEPSANADLHYMQSDLKDYNTVCCILDSSDADIAEPEPVEQKLFGI